MKVEDLVNDYISKGFGSMNKNDFEVFLFNEAMKMPSYESKSNFEISVLFRMPESKVKRLKYESALKYGTSPFVSKDGQGGSLEKTYGEMLKKMLLHPTIRQKEEVIVFSVENTMLQLYIGYLLKKDGRVLDNSFNPEVVVVKFDDFEYLLRQIYGDQEVNKLLLDIKKKNGSLNSIIDFFKKYKDQIAHIIVSLTIEGIKVALSKL